MSQRITMDEDCCLVTSYAAFSRTGLLATLNRERHPMSTRELKSLIDAAQGRTPVDTLFTHARIVDVYGQRIVPGSVAVKEGVIVGVSHEGEEDAPLYEAAETIDCKGRYLSPGFIDGHLHIESSNIRPAEYARMAATRGTTTAIADSHEICNVAGLDGLRFMMEDGKRAPISIKYMMPSCVPALPDEQAGATICADDMRAFMAKHPGEVFGLGEMMNLPGVFSADKETLARIDAAQRTESGLVDGHAPLVSGNNLNAYAATGIIADHESTNPEEALAKLSRGMYVMMREGTCSHDLANLAPLLLEDPARARRCCFATDDRAPSDALAAGAIDNACRIAIEAGIDPITAISMGTLSAAECFGLDHGKAHAIERRGAIAPGKRADILLLDDLTFTSAPYQVYAAGKLVARQGTFTGCIAPETAEVQRLAQGLHASVKLPRLSKAVFDFPFQPKEAVIDVIPGKAITGMLRPETNENLQRIVLIERHGRGVAVQQELSANSEVSGIELVGKHIGRGWLHGYPINNGAIASTVGHDSHNVCVVGSNPDDMLKAVEALGQGGHVLVRKGEVVAKVPLPLGGLMSDGAAEEVAKQHDAFMKEARAMGIKEPLDPIMGIIFLPLAVIPTLRIRPEGMFDASTFKYI